MSTRGLIAIIDEDGSCRSIYCHHDMYPSHAGKVLAEHYCTREAVEGLLALGDLSALGCSLAECEAYCRDRGEELHEPTQWADRWQLSREAFDRFWANYCYLFMDGIWHVSAGQGWIPVAELMMLGRFDYLAQPGGDPRFFSEARKPRNDGTFQRDFLRCVPKNGEKPVLRLKSHFEKTDAFLKAHSLPHSAENG